MKLQELNEYGVPVEEPVPKENKVKNMYFSCDDWLQPSVLVYYILSPRNKGKSTAMDRRGIERWKNREKLGLGGKWIIIRNSYEEIKSYKKTGVAYWRELGFELKGQEFYEIETGEQCGIIVSLGQWGNLASGKYDNYDTILFDECIPRSSHIVGDRYVMFCELLFHFERMDTLEVWMSGNYIDKSKCPFLLEWQIKDNIKVQECLYMEEWNRTIGRVIQLSDEDYSPRDERKVSVAMAFARCRKKYYKASVKGGFAMDNKHWIIFQRDIKDWEAITGVILNKRLCVFGSFKHNGVVKYCIREYDKERDNINFVSLTTIDSVAEGNISSIDSQEVAQELYDFATTEKLWFTTYQIEKDFHKFIALSLGNRRRR